MDEPIPESKWRRGIAGGKTAARVGGEVLNYLARKPFLSKKQQVQAKAKMDRRSAEAIFDGLSLLKGTALKIAQLLSLEMDLFPLAVQRQLEKSYNQVPPINRALARKAVINALGRPPEKIFAGFELTAFAAASLGQVHRAQGRSGAPLAVKVQYPGIRKTIENDMQLVHSLIRPLADYDLLAPALEEIRARLLEETDYRLEADNMAFFAKSLKMDGVSIPVPYPEISGDTVLSADFISGPTLDAWLATDPPQAHRDAVARRLYDIFLKGFYELNCIHADPNPGNFIIRPDLSVGLVDFGCVRRFAPTFVERYRQLPRIIIRGERNEYFRLLRDFHFLAPDVDPETEDAIFEVAYGFGRWLGRMFEADLFDFGQNREIFAQGRELTNEMLKHRKQMGMNPDFILLDRTRYGLLRIFEKMRARVCIRNAYEWS